MDSVEAPSQPIQLLELYANNTNVRTSVWDVELTFSASAPGEPAAQAVRVRMSHQMALSVAALLADAIAGFEAAGGAPVHVLPAQVRSMNADDAMKALRAYIDKKNPALTAPKKK